jgi:Rho GTPase-activating protein 39
MPKPKVEAPEKGLAPTAAIPPSPSTPTKGPTVAGKEISNPVLNMGRLCPISMKVMPTFEMNPNFPIDATLQLSPVKARSARTPILIETPPLPASARTVKTLSTGYVPRYDLSFLAQSFCSCSAHPILPQDLASDIQQFVESEFAQQYFATHRTGFIFKRKVPLGQMMTWQRSPLAAPLLNLARQLHKDAVRTFRAVQRLMGDSEKGATAAQNVPRLEEARWLLGEGLTYGELRDEIYCQVMKQLTSNPNAYVLRLLKRQFMSIDTSPPPPGRVHSAGGNCCVYY